MVGVLGKKDLCGSWREGNCVGHRECGEVEERLLGNHRQGGAEENLFGIYIIITCKHIQATTTNRGKSCSQNVSDKGQFDKILELTHN